MKTVPIADHARISMENGRTGNEMIESITAEIDAEFEREKIPLVKKLIKRKTGQIITLKQEIELLYAKIGESIPKEESKPREPKISRRLSLECEEHIMRVLRQDKNALHGDTIESRVTEALPTVTVKQIRAVRTRMQKEGKLQRSGRTTSTVYYPAAGKT